MADCEDSRKIIKDYYGIEDSWLIHLIGNRAGKCYETHFVTTLAETLGHLSDTQHIERLHGAHTTRYYERMLRLCIQLFRVQKAEYQYAERASNLIIPLDSDARSPQEYFARLASRVESGRYRLKAVVNCLRHFRDCIKTAAQHGEIQDLPLEKLYTVMKALQEHFPEACVELGEDRQNLIDPTHAWWWLVEPTGMSPGYRNLLMNLGILKLKQSGWRKKSSFKPMVVYRIPMLRSHLLCLPSLY